MRVRCFKAARTAVSSPLGWWLAVCLVYAHPGMLHGQWPAGLRGVVLDDLTGRPVAGAQIEGAGLGAPVLSDAHGRFHLRALDAGKVHLRVQALGYHTHSVPLSPENGQESWIQIRLSPAPLVLNGLGAEGARGTTRLERGGAVATITAAQMRGTSSLPALLDRLPGVTVRQDAPGGPAAVSIRGSDPRAVLVLVDGVPLNDAVTGTADPSTLSPSALREIRLRPGAQTAQFGPGATAGVIEIDTRAGGSPLGFSTGTGSLGTWRGGADVERDLGAWRASSIWRSSGTEGAFDYRLPDDLGGQSGRRRNADVRTDALVASLERSGARSNHAGSLARTRISLHADRTERGLPGPGYNPSPAARQSSHRAQVVLRDVRVVALNDLDWRITGLGHEVRFRDAAPPAGAAYDERTRAWDVDLHATLRRPVQLFRSAALGGGASSGALEFGATAGYQSIDATALDQAAMGGATRARGAVWGGLSSALPWRPAAGRIGLDASTRVDAHPDVSGPQLSHSLALTWSRSGVSVQAAHRSAFNPPTLADQYFREGVGVRANPTLRPERIPSEFELTLMGSRDWGALGVTAYRSDVKDRIVWQPDFRFVWSPTNTDIKRRGLDAWAGVDAGRLATALTGLRVDAAVSWTRAVYDRPGPADTVQLAYRPERSGSLNLRWSRSDWTVFAQGQFTGKRYPVPSPVNALPAFWAWDAGVTRTQRVGAWTVEVDLTVRRLLDTPHTLIHGFPGPGRTWSLSLGTRRDAR